ncbi:hypothetical protein NEOLI_004722 [Neolecta irregularis DAH-3]|uniref:Uncharacterized protein n=1 Tax=Neolecta irregularis (strain DAH-3) TaxID=1198029 RepID=A0A1U7LIQ0_NEOID|nr:hypothetical protein NEOLI_004722 [Neolecta irregularis DAH-3]|eukprot:OLL22527.1 hypothetical protein NEOLI_004722 [Neolecta irregularis DAH-3]
MLTDADLGLNLGFHDEDKAPVLTSSNSKMTNDKTSCGNKNSVPERHFIPFTVQDFLQNVFRKTCSRKKKGLNILRCRVTRSKLSYSTPPKMFPGLIIDASSCSHGSSWSLNRSSGESLPTRSPKMKQSSKRPPARVKQDLIIDPSTDQLQEIPACSKRTLKSFVTITQVASALGIPLDLSTITSKRGKLRTKNLAAKLKSFQDGNEAEITVIIYLWPVGLMK